jgi:hypothetical protein
MKKRNAIFLMMLVIAFYSFGKDNNQIDENNK